VAEKTISNVKIRNEDIISRNKNHHSEYGLRVSFDSIVENHSEYSLRA
jgi:hypothetical protein